MRASLIGLQAALTLFLLISCLLVGRAFLKLLGTDLGFRTGNVVTLKISLEGTRHSGSGEWQYYSAAIDKIRSLHGVISAGAINYLPLGNQLYVAESFKLDSGKKINFVVTNGIAGNFFAAMKTSVLAGRAEFNHVKSGEHLAIVNAAFAKRAGLGSDIVGRNLHAPWSSAPYRVIGLVRTVRFGGPDSSEYPQIYFPLEEEPPPALSLVARVNEAPTTYLPRIRDAVRSLDPQVPVYDIKTLDERLTGNLARPRFYAFAIALLSLLALLLAAVGIAGTTAYLISQRRHEVGVRLAVGASYGRVRQMILTESLKPLVLGMAAGLLLAVFASRFLANLIDARIAAEHWVYSVGGAFLFFIGLAAAWLASRKVLAIDPASSLRTE